MSDADGSARVDHTGSASDSGNCDFSWNGGASAGTGSADSARLPDWILFIGWNAGAFTGL